MKNLVENASVLRLSSATIGLAAYCRWATQTRKSVQRCLEYIPQPKPNLSVRERKLWLPSRKMSALWRSQQARASTNPERNFKFSSSVTSKGFPHIVWLINVHHNSVWWALMNTTIRGKLLLLARQDFGISFISNKLILKKESQLLVQCNTHTVKGDPTTKAKNEKEIYDELEDLE